jgi:hypothetical protein
MFEFIRNLVTRRSSKMPPPSAAVPSLSPQLARLDELEQLETAISTILAAGAEKLAGRMFVLSLDTIRQRYGTSWRYVSEKAHRSAESYLRSELGQTDILAPVGSVDFILILFQGAKREAPARALRLDQGMVMAVTGDDLGLAGVTAKEVVPADGGAVKFRNLTHEDLKRAQTPAGPPVVDLESELLDEDEEDGFPNVDQMLDSVKFQMHNVVDLASKAVVMRRLAPHSDLFGADSDEQAIFDNFPDPRVRTKIDLRTLKLGRLELKKIVGIQGAPRICVPVSFETVANNYTKNLFLKVAQKVPQPARRLMAFQILAVPAGVAQNRLIEIVATVRPFGSGTILSLDPGFRDFGTLAEHGLIAVCGDAPGTDGLDTLLGGARAAGISTLVHSVKSAAVRDQAISLGATFGCGAFFGVEQPG